MRGEGRPYGGRGPRGARTPPPRRSGCRGRRRRRRRRDPRTRTHSRQPGAALQWSHGASLRLPLRSRSILDLEIRSIDDDLRMRVQDRTKESRNTVLGTGRCCPSKSRSLARHRSQGRVSYTEKAKRPPRERRGTGRRTTAAGHLISRPSDRRARSPLLLPAVTPLLSPASHAGNDEPDKPGYARPKHGGLDEHWAHGVLLR